MTMTKELKDKNKQTPQDLFYCPTTRQKVEAGEQKQYDITSGKLLWWQCPACKGWHALVLEANKGDRD